MGSNHDKKKMIIPIDRKLTPEHFISLHHQKIPSSLGDNFRTVFLRFLRVAMMGAMMEDEKKYYLIQNWILNILSLYSIKKFAIV